MAIEDHLSSKQNPSPAQKSGEATISKSFSARHIENRETSTDEPNKEIAKVPSVIRDADGKIVTAPVPEEINTRSTVS